MQSNVIIYSTDHTYAKNLFTYFTMRFSGFYFRFKYSLLVFIAVLISIYIEFTTYWVLPLRWVNLPDCRSDHCTKLLLVSDPQIIDYEWDKLFFMDTIAMWDSDRYIQRTFSKAVNFVNPDIIIFLGDLTDKGYSATEPEFLGYMKRLKDIFVLPETLKNTKLIFTPGDNDIGGFEENLIVENVERFDKMFNETGECILIDQIQFCKVNLMTVNIQESNLINSDIIRIALTHSPLLRRETYFLKEVVQKIRPLLILSGHLHASTHLVTYESDLYRVKHNDILPHDTQTKIYKFHEGLIHEINVPTCSYRMGVKNMGYGAVSIDTRNNFAYYNVLWLPDRFQQITLLIVVNITTLVIIVYIKCFRKNFFWRHFNFKRNFYLK